ncbi:MAG TPA: hypothetical protein VFS08_13185 [Gemmatimonadaceae bacterium]|nr:hypothetical protein [Gemmatimonadaceae bacterium]
MLRSARRGAPGARRQVSRLASGLARAAVGGALALAPATLTAQRAGGYTYDFRIETGDGDAIHGVTYVSGDRARIELRDGDGDPKAGYLLVTDGGRTLVAVSPDRHEYSVTTAEQFERIVGTAMRAADKVLTLELDDLEVVGRRFDGDATVAGRPTRHARLSSDFTLRIGALGFTTRTQQHVDVDYYMAPDLALPRNPLFELFAGLPLVLAQHDRDFVTRQAAGRAALVGRGMPLKTVVTTRSRDDDGDVEEHRAVVEVTKVALARHDAELFRIPEGYRKTEGFSWSVKQ